MYERIFAIAKEKGMQQKELAKQLDIPPSVLSDWKSGRLKPSVEMICNIAELFDVSIDYLLKGEASQPRLESFTERVLALIQEKGTTKNKLLTDLGLNHNSFGDWAKKQQAPSSETVVKIADYFGVTTDYLLKGETSQPRLENREDTGMAQERRFAALPNNQKLRALRREEGLAIAEMANKLGISEKDYRYLEERECYWSGLSGKEINYAVELAKHYFHHETFEVNKDYHINEDEYLQTDLSLAITREMKKLGDDKKELAKILGVDLISVVSWTSGERIPKGRCLDVLGKYLGLDNAKELALEASGQ